MINPFFKKRFKGKLKDLKRAILDGELDDELDIDFLIDDPEKETLPKHNPLSSKPIEQKLIEAAKMKDAHSAHEGPKQDWKMSELLNLPRGAKEFLDKFIKFGQEMGKKEVEQWPGLTEFINSPMGQALQTLTLLSMMLEGSEDKAKEINNMRFAVKGDSTDTPCGEGSPETLHPNSEIEKTTPLWFKRKVTSILKDNMQKRPGGNRTSGELNFKRLYKIPCGSNRVFHKKEHISKKQYNVVLLIDCSGSMSGSKLQTAATCASLITRDFQGLVRLKIKTFNRRDTVIKEFDEKFSQHKMNEPMDRIIAEGNSGNGGTNHDWYAVMQADQDVRKEIGEKMIISISDAEPCCGEIESQIIARVKFPASMSENGYAMLAEQNKEIHSRGKVRLMSIVVGSHGKGPAGKERMQTLYQRNFSHINGYDEIYRAVTEVLSSAIKRK